MQKSDLYKIFRALMIVYGVKSAISLFEKLLSTIK